MCTRRSFHYLRPGGGAALGSTHDFEAALTHDAALGRVLAEARGPEELETELLAAMDRERQAQLDPNVRAERLAARWKAVEQDYEKLELWRRSRRA